MLEMMIELQGGAKAPLYENIDYECIKDRSRVCRNTV